MEQVAETETIHDLIAVYEPETMIKIHGFEVQLQQAMILGRSCLENMAETDQISYIAAGLAEAGTLREEHARYVPQVQAETETTVHKQVTELLPREVSVATEKPAITEANYQIRLKQELPYSAVEPVSSVPEAIIHTQYEERQTNMLPTNVATVPDADMVLMNVGAMPIVNAPQLIQKPDAAPLVTEVISTPALSTNVYETLTPDVPAVPGQSVELAPPTLTTQLDSNPIAETVAEYSQEYLNIAYETESEHDMQLPEPRAPLDYEVVFGEIETQDKYYETTMTTEDLVILLQAEPSSTETEQNQIEVPVIVTDLAAGLTEATPEQQVELQPLVEQLQVQLVALTELLPDAAPETVEEIKLQITELCAEFLDVLGIEYVQADLNELVEHIIVNWETRIQHFDSNFESLGTHERKLFKKLAPQFQSMARTGLHVPLGMLALIHLPHRPQLLST